MKASSSQDEIVFEMPADCSSNQAILALSEEIREALERQHPKRLVLDGSRVIRLGSVAIGTLATLAKEIETMGGTLILKSFTPPARRPFEICRVARQFNWED